MKDIFLAHNKIIPHKNLPLQHEQKKKLKGEDNGLHKKRHYKLQWKIYSQFFWGDDGDDSWSMLLHGVEEQSPIHFLTFSDPDSWENGSLVPETGLMMKNNSGWGRSFAEGAHGGNNPIGMDRGFRILSDKLLVVLGLDDDTSMSML